MVSPVFTTCPTLASILNTFPAAPAFTWMLPAPADATFGAGAGAAFGAAFGAAGATGAAPAPFSSTVTSYTFPFTVIV